MQRWQSRCTCWETHIRVGNHVSGLDTEVFYGTDQQLSATSTNYQAAVRSGIEVADLRVCHFGLFEELAVIASPYLDDAGVISCEQLAAAALVVGNGQTPSLMGIFLLPDCFSG